MSPWHRKMTVCLYPAHFLCTMSASGSLVLTTVQCLSLVCCAREKISYRHRPGLGLLWDLYWLFTCRLVLPRIPSHYERVSSFWEILLHEVYAILQDNIETMRQAFEAFLKRYPYCYGYWKKYADMEKKHGDSDLAERVSLPKSTTAATGYMSRFYYVSLGAVAVLNSWHVGAVFLIHRLGHCLLPYMQQSTGLLRQATMLGANLHLLWSICNLLVFGCLSA